MWIIAMLLMMLVKPAMAFNPCQATYNPTVAEATARTMHRGETNEVALADKARAEEQAKLDACMRDFNKSIKPPS